MSKRIGELRTILKKSLDRERVHELVPTAREVCRFHQSAQSPTYECVSGVHSL